MSDFVMFPCQVVKSETASLVMPPTGTYGVNDMSAVETFTAGASPCPRDAFTVSATNGTTEPVALTASMGQTALGNQKFGIDVFPAGGLFGDVPVPPSSVTTELPPLMTADLYVILRDCAVNDPGPSTWTVDVGGVTATGTVSHSLQ